MQRRAAVAQRVQRIVRRVDKALGVLVYERRFGLDTRGLIALSEHDETRCPYEGMPWRQLRRCLDDVSSHDVLLDAGCGKGRAVFQAARGYPFARIVGFDLSADLVEAARGNVERNRARLRCRDVTLVVADATSWPVPDDVTVVFMFNPFRGEVFERFLAHLCASLERRPRRLRIVYAHPLEHAAIERSGRFRLVRSRRATLTSLALRWYESVPGRVAAGERPPDTEPASRL